MRLAALAAVLVAGLSSGCGQLGQVTNGEPAPPVTGENREIPDPCTPLDRNEATGRTGRDTIPIDYDFCQWQRRSGQLRV